MPRSALAPLILAALPACAPAPVPSPSPARPVAAHRFRPEPGTPTFYCPDPPSSSCRRNYPEACEAECGDGNGVSCLHLARYYQSSPPHEGAGDDPPPRDPARARDLRALACRLGVPDACHQLIMWSGMSASGPDIHTAYTVLEQACARDPACGCTLLGDALTMNERHDERGLALLDVACVRGALTACDITDMLAELCSREPTGSACALLRRQARVAPPEPPLPAWPERAP
ncbi:MAG: sel1 repeat family protein [Polyangiaceae bacterium]|nr:sel1 repeat family protein [Polyangiaceae bacterium]